MTSLVVGKGILGLLTEAMHTDPLAIYREYVQNAADSIDEAVADGTITHAQGAVDISIDRSSRTVYIRDNGLGVPAHVAERCLKAFGASKKHPSARGFRGVGRLGGISYCRRLTFRTQAQGESKTSTLTWDCEGIKSALRDNTNDLGLSAIVEKHTEFSSCSSEEATSGFFEVELSGVVRYRNDRLLNREEISSYLAQVAPVPFSPTFRFAEDIQNFLTKHGISDGVRVFVDKSNEPLYRPYRDEFEQDQFHGLKCFQLDDRDGGILSVGWLLDHGYHGALPRRLGIGGLRLRHGNIQVGTEDILRDIFPEPRFAMWCVGEVHCVSDQLVPNGRRDHFEQNADFSDLLNKLAVLARDIGRTCRSRSASRNKQRSFELEVEKTDETLRLLEQRITRPADTQLMLRESKGRVARIREMLEAPGLFSNAQIRKEKRSVITLEKRLKAVGPSVNGEDPLSGLNPAKRRHYQEIFGLIVECSQNKAAAVALLERIKARL